MMSELYKPVGVAFGQSCINMNTAFSCRNNCVYCFGKNWSGRSQRFNPDDMINELPSVETIGNLPVCINNSAADPFQPSTIDSTMRMFDLLVEKRVKNIMIITKEYIPEWCIEKFEHTASNIFIFISYSGLSKEYESLVDDRRLELLKRLGKSNIHTILYARPIIIKNNKIVNDLQKVVEASVHCDAVVWSSLRTDDNIKETDVNDLLPEATGSSLHKSHKRIADDKLVQIEQTLSKCACHVWRKTSCAISTILGIPDYNCHWSDEFHYGCAACPEAQRTICKQQAVKTPVFDNTIQAIIDRYKLPAYRSSLEGAWLLESNMKSFSCLRAGILRKLTGFQVKFEWDNEIITAENLAYAHYELRGEKEGNIPVAGFK
jgi:DNA repair photolyase